MKITLDNVKFEAVNRNNESVKFEGSLGIEFTSEEVIKSGDQFIQMLDMAKPMIQQLISHAIDKDNRRETRKHYRRNRR